METYRNIVSLQLFGEGGGGEGQGTGDSGEAGVSQETSRKQDTDSGKAASQEIGEPDIPEREKEEGKNPEDTEAPAQEESGDPAAASEDAQELEEILSRREEALRHGNAQRLYDQWVRQAEEVKGMYPGLDLRRECKDPEFLRLLGAGVDVGSAYLVRHKEEILPNLIASTARIVERKLAGKLRTEGIRPGENGLSAQGAALTRTDVTKLSKADRAAIRRRVADGERIRF